MTNLNNTEFYKWLDFNEKESADGNIRAYVSLIKHNIKNLEYVVKLNLRNPAICPDNSIMKNISFLVPREYFLELQYCAKTFGSVFGVLFPPLLPHLTELLYIEWLLYMEPGFLKYRDHFVHMLKVAFTGHKFLENENLFEKISINLFKDGHFERWCKRNELGKEYFQDNNYNTKELKGKGKELQLEKEEIIKIAFFLAAIFHDFGYGNYFLGLYRERLSRINSWLQQEADFLNVNSSFFMTLEKSLPYHFVRENHMSLKDNKSGKINEKRERMTISGFFRDCLPLNHSIASTFTILTIAEQLREAGALKDNLYIAFQLAAEAIMMHDMTGENNWNHLKCRKNGHFLDSDCSKSIPLAILLILSDELSVWGRCRIEPKASESHENHRQIIFEMENPKIENIEVEITEEEILVSANNIPELEKTFPKDLSFLKADKKDDYLTLWDYKVRVSQK